MLMESGRWDSIANGDYSYRMKENYSKFSNDYSVLEEVENQSLPTSSLPDAGFVEHLVSRFDTLSGVAIKYGVEVADIRKVNGLVTDRQMFGLRSLRIPLPGRHPPSPCLLNGSDTPRRSSADETAAQHSPPDLLDSFQSLRLKTTPQRVSSAMSLLQGYYGHKATERRSISEGFEMASLSRKGEARYRKSRSVNNGSYDETVDIMSAGEAKAEPDQSNEKLIRRRQKSEPDFTACIPEVLLKSLSTSSLQDQDSRNLSSLWPSASIWSLKPDFQAVSTLGIARPIFDALPKPIYVRKNKTALD